jgi:hypothetical protein
MAPSINNQDFSSEFHIQQAHDRIFRESMQDIEIALPLALLSLPSQVKSQIDWETLEIVKAPLRSRLLRWVSPYLIFQ